MGAHEKLACIDLEGVLIPELWPKIAVHTGIKELFITTRELPDYDALMRQRIALLRQHGVTLSDVQKIINTVEHFAGPKHSCEGWKRTATAQRAGDWPMSANFGPR